MQASLLEILEPILDTAAITSGNAALRVLLVANTGPAKFKGWARLDVDFPTRSLYAIRISRRSGAVCHHCITDETIGQPDPATGKFRWAFTLWFNVSIAPCTLDGFVAEWLQYVDRVADTKNPCIRVWLPALEAESHTGTICLPYPILTAQSQTGCT